MNPAARTCPETLRQFIDEDMNTYPHAGVLNPGPNITSRPPVGCDFFVGARNALIIEAALGLIIWACYHLLF